MQELVQTTKTEEVLTFEDICPDFNMLIREHGWNGCVGKSFKVGKKDRTLKNTMCCIMGEAHGN